MSPEILQSLTAAHGIPMPNEDAKHIDKLAQLFRRERRLRELVRRLGRSADIGDDDISTATYFGCAAAGKNTRSTRAPQWSHAECAQAGQGLADKYWQAMRYVYALDDSVFHTLSLALWEWALWKREREKWPQTIVNLAGGESRYMRDLVDMHMLEVRVPSRFVRPRPDSVDIRQVLMNVTERVWDRRLKPVYGAIGHEFEIWLSIAHGHMQHRMSDDLARV
jgi:hypothetical protein